MEFWPVRWTVDVTSTDAERENDDHHWQKHGRELTVSATHRVRGSTTEGGRCGGRARGGTRGGGVAQQLPRLVGLIASSQPLARFRHRGSSDSPGDSCAGCCQPQRDSGLCSTATAALVCTGGSSASSSSSRPGRYALRRLKNTRATAPVRRTRELVKT